MPKYRNILHEALLAKAIRVNSANEAIAAAINRHEIGQLILQEYPQEQRLTLSEYDNDQVLRTSLNSVIPNFELPDWTGKTIAQILASPAIHWAHSTWGRSTFCAKKTAVISSEVNITFQALFDATELGESGWLLPSGAEIWFV